MRSSTLPGLCVVLLYWAPALGGCSDDDSTGQNNNTSTEHLSDDLLQALNNDPDFTCFDATDPVITFSTDTDVTGVVEDFEEGYAVEGAVVKVYGTLQDLLDDQPFDESAPSDVHGAYTITVPGNVQRTHWRMTDPSGEDYFDTFEINDPVAGMPPGPPQTTGKDRLIISTVTMETVPATLGIQRIEGRGIIAGRVYDCQRNEVEHAAIRVYDGPASDPDRQLISVYEGGNRNSFYFVSGMPSRLQQFTDPEGQFVVANLVAGGSVHVEFWGRTQAAWMPTGYQDCSEGCLISTQEVPVVGDTIVITDMLPLYSSN